MSAGKDYQTYFVLVRKFTTESWQIRWSSILQIHNYQLLRRSVDSRQCPYSTVECFFFLHISGWTIVSWRRSRRTSLTWTWLPRTKLLRRRTTRLQTLLLRSPGRPPQAWPIWPARVVPSRRSPSLFGSWLTWTTAREGRSSGLGQHMS